MPRVDETAATGRVFNGRGRSLGRQEHQCLPMCDLWNSCTWCRWVDGSGYGKLVWRNGNQSTLATFFFHCLWWVFWVCREVWCQPPKKIGIFPCLQDSQHILTTLRSFRSIVFFVPSTGRSIPKVLWASAIAWLENANLIWRSGGFGISHSSNRKIPNDLFEMEGFLL